MIHDARKGQFEGAIRPGNVALCDGCGPLEAD
jgi:hypothetical protein